jgi:hypothetical protein
LVRLPAKLTPGPRYAGVHVLGLVAGLDVRVLTGDGELLRALTLDYQPQAKRERCPGTGAHDVPGHHNAEEVGFEPGARLLRRPRS